MKKTTFLILFILAFQFGNAQQTISFEASEGYVLGNINSQNGWDVTGDNEGGFIMNQIVSDEAATDGTNSFKIAADVRFAWQENKPIMGGFYNYATSVPYKTAVISADIYIDDIVGDASDYRFGTVAVSAGFYTSIIDFSFDGKIYVLSNDDFVEIIETWESQTWYNIKIEMTNTDISYFINNILVEQSPIGIDQSYPIDEVRFVHDNFSDFGFAYLDNFRTNNEPLSIDEATYSTFKHYFNTHTKKLTLTSSSSVFESIRLYNSLGQSVMDMNLSKTKEVLYLSNLQDGIYLATVTIEGREKTVKFLKQ